MTLADRIAVIKDGKLQTFCSPDELYDHPQTMFIAGFVGNPPMNFIDVEVNRVNGDFRACRDDLKVVISTAQGEKAVSKGKVTMGIRPEDITVADEGITGEAYLVEPLGRDDLVDVLVGDIHIHVLADPALGLKIGNKVRLRFNTAKLQFFDPQTEQSLLW
jgi:ABC-type sugar transport system ATPase subunit